MSRAAEKRPAGKLDGALERAERGERVVIRRGKRPVAAVVPFEDFKLLEELEDRLDVEAAEKAEEEGREKGTISLADLKKKLGF